MDDTMISTQHQPPKASKTPWLLFSLTLVALGAVLYFGWGVWRGERKRAEAAELALGEAKVKLLDVEHFAAELSDRVKALEAEKLALAADREQLSMTLKEAEAELARLKATYDSLEDKLQSEIKKGEIKLSQAEGRIKVDLVDKVLFDSGQAELSERGVEVLTRVANVLAKVEDRKIQVSGHTDDTPIVNELAERYPTNWELSTARAVNVVRFLSEKGGVKAKKLIATGHGQYDPVASNATPRGRAKNRRIEILLIPELKKQKAAPGEVKARAGR